jgi:hypothetical protein
VNGQLSELKGYCHEKGYGLVKMEKQQDIVSCETKGTGKEEILIMISVNYIASEIILK